MKKIAASDSRQSVGLKWKLRKGLEENVTFKEDGTMEVGKNAVVDGTLTLNSPENLAFKTGAISSEPEGYAVDGSGNVTIAGALKANNNGNVEVLKNLNVDGNIIAGTVAKATLPWYFNPAQEEGPDVVQDSYVLEAIKSTEDGFQKCFACITGLYSEVPDTHEVIMQVMFGFVTNSSGNLCSTISEVISDGRVSVEKTTNLITQSTLPLLLEQSLENSEYLNTTYKEQFSQAKYQHTVTIKGTRPAQGGGSCFITFTAYSSNNTPIDSAQDLIVVFGGCDLSVSGMYSPSQGTNFGAVKLYLKGASTIEDASLAYIDPSLVNEAGVKMSECGNLSFSDDVCIPK